MNDYFSRSEVLLGAERMKRLRTIRVILFGVGGVGSWCAEALIRTGLMHLTIVDGDTVQPSNVNRQLPATRETIGRPKVEVLRERLLSINPEAEIEALPMYYEAVSMPGGVKGLTDEGVKGLRIEDLSGYDYVIDAIDSVPAKTDLILRATRTKGVKIYSSMGAALRFDPTLVTTGELMSIKGDALANAVRSRMKRLGAKPSKRVRCVYSTEQAMPIHGTAHFADGIQTETPVKGSLMQVTAVFGCVLASLVVKNL